MGLRFVAGEIQGTDRAPEARPYSALSRQQTIGAIAICRYLWREHRGLTQEELGARTGLSGPYLSQIESGKREGTIKVFSALAKALDVDIDGLVVTS